MDPNKVLVEAKNFNLIFLGEDEDSVVVMRKTTESFNTALHI